MAQGRQPPSWFSKLYIQLAGPMSYLRDQMISAIYSEDELQTSPETAQLNLHQLEKECLHLSGMKLDEEIFSRDRAINLQSWIHQISCGNKNKGTNMVLLHGYGGTSLSFARMFSTLSRRFCIYALDHLGMGLSSRKIFLRDWSRSETINYFIDAIEQWRKAALKDEKMTLVGHSFGGYMATCYAEKYPDYIQKLILVSPAGMQFGDQETSMKAWQQISKNSWWVKVARKVTQYHPTPSDLVNLKLIGQKILDLGLGSRFGLSPEQKRAYMNYFKACCALQPNSQNVIYQIFYFPQTRTKDPISEILKRNRFPFEIDIYFGTRDWMYHENNLKLLEPENVSGNRVSIKFIEKAGHQMTFDNPKRLCEEIIKGDLVRIRHKHPPRERELPVYLQI